MRYRVSHRTAYTYTEPVTVSHHVARLQPRPTPWQTPRDFSLQIDPAPAVSTIRTDYFGNQVCVFSIQEIHTQLEITSVSQVDVESPRALDFNASPAWETVVARFRDPVSPELTDPYQFVFDSPHVRAGPDYVAFARSCFGAGEPLLAATARLCTQIHHDFQFDPAATTVSTPVETVMLQRRGVCQDFAHLALACLRSLGLPARYVSGYLRTEPPAGEAPLVGCDYSHAWFSVFCPGIGFVDFDPTNDMPLGERHVTVAYGRDFSDVSPVAGVVTGGGTHSVQVAVNVSDDK
jgi:transglutaminase-like putative cysteine protease